MKTLAGKVGAILALAVTFGWAAAAQAASPWTVFGDVEVTRDRGNWELTLTSDCANEAEPFAGVCFTPPRNMTFASIRRLTADVEVTEGGAGGGSPRFQVTVVNPETGAERNVFVYLGTSPAFDDEPGVLLARNENLAGTTDLRVDSTQVGGPFYGDWQDALDLVGTWQVSEVCLVVDGCWFFGEDGVQTVVVDNVQVNNFKLTGRNFRP